MSGEAPESGWTGTIFLTAVAVIAMAILAFALSGYRDARISQDGEGPQASRSIGSNGDGAR